MPKVAELFPRSNAYLNAEALDRDLVASPDCYQCLLDVAWEALDSWETAGGKALVGESLVGDLDDLNEVAGFDAASVEATRVGVGVLVAIRCAAGGDLDEARVWLLRGIGGTDPLDTSWDLRGIRYLRVRALAGDETAANLIAGFTDLLLYMARSAGYLREIADAIGAALALEVARYPFSTPVTSGLTQALSWARSIGREDVAGPIRERLTAAVFVLERHAEGAELALPLRHAIVCSLDIGPDRTAAADDMLASIRDDTAASVVAGVLATSCESDAKRAKELIPRFLETFQRLREEWSDASAQELGDLRARWFDTLGAPLTALARAGNVGEVATLVRSWYGVSDAPIEDALAARILVGIHGTELTYAWNGGAQVAAAPESSSSISDAINHAVGTALVGTNPDAPYLESPASAKRDRSKAQHLANVTRNALQLHEAPDFSAQLGTDMLFLPLPGYPLPYQAVLAERGQTPTLWVSLLEPAPDRRPQRVLIVQGDTDLSALETELVEATFSKAGANVDRAARNDAAAVARAALGSDEYDVIWVSAHGRQPEYSPEHSFIELPRGQVLSESDLAQGRDHPTGRRLLVLNSCEAATTIQRGGPRARGLAAAATSPAQAVVGHQWSVQEDFACAFGVLFGVAVVEREGFAAAFDAALRWVRRPWSENEVMLTTRGLRSDLVGRLSPGEEFSANILDFGAPALYA